MEQGQTLVASLITFVLADVLSPRQVCASLCLCPVIMDGFPGMKYFMAVRLVARIRLVDHHRLK